MYYSAALADKFQASNYIVFFGGAGVSTESGIPDFRSAHGLYHAHNDASYEEMLSINFCMSHLDDFWTFYKKVLLYPNAKPNAAHDALAKLESKGELKAVITQNIDGLHQLAGSKTVLELHGTIHQNSCMNCPAVYNLEYILSQSGTPHCKHCGGVIRPDIIMYGEMLNDSVMRKAIDHIKSCDLLIVGGTSLVVHPAAGLIEYMPKGAELVLINRDPTPYNKRADLVIRDNIADVLSGLCD